jgi:hypothetical protein
MKETNDTKTPEKSDIFEWQRKKNSFSFNFKNSKIAEKKKN